MTEKRASTSRRSGSSAKARKPVAAKRAAAKSKAPVKKKAPARAAKSAARSVAKLPTARAAAVKRPKTAAPPASEVVKVIELALDDMKAVQVKVLDVRKLTDIADTLVIASGNSDRHVRSIADKVVEQAKKAGFRPMGVEGQRDGEWVLVDLQDAIVHIMLPRVRELYRLEDLWDVSAARRDAAVGE